jgi:hypothetical protein
LSWLALRFDWMGEPLAFSAAKSGPAIPEFGWLDFGRDHQVANDSLVDDWSDALFA